MYKTVQLVQEKDYSKTDLTRFGIPPAQSTYQTSQLNHQDIPYNFDDLQAAFFPFQDGAKAKLNPARAAMWFFFFYTGDLF